MALDIKTIKKDLTWLNAILAAANLFFFFLTGSTFNLVVAILLIILVGIRLSQNKDTK